MKSTTSMYIIAVSVCMLLTCGCSAMDYTVAPYVPQNTVTLQGNLSVGDFTYVGARTFIPARQDAIDISPFTQVFKVGFLVPDHIKKATIAELHKTGINTAQGGRFVLSGHIAELCVQYTSAWTYTIVYTITDTSTGLTAFYGGFHEYQHFKDNYTTTAGTIDKLIVSTYSKMLNIVAVREILKKSLAVATRP